MLTHKIPQSNNLRESIDKKICYVTTMYAKISLALIKLPLTKQMSIGPNGGKPVCPGWEQTPQKFQPIFGGMFNKFFQAFQFVESALGLQNISLFGSQSLKPPSMMSADKKIAGLGSSGKGK